MLAVLVRFTMKEGFEERFLERVRRQAQDSLEREPACRRFDVCVDAQDGRHVLLYEIYDTSAAFAEHLETAHFLAFEAESREWIDDKVVERWTLT